MFLVILIPQAHQFYERLRIPTPWGEADFTSKKPIESVQFKSEVKTPGSVFISQEYPRAQGYHYRQSIDLHSDDAVMTWQNSEQAFWLGIGNVGDTNFSNPTLFLDFKREVKVKLDSGTSKGWIEIDPNISYVYSAKGVLQPGVLTRLNPLFVKFPDEGVYRVKCTVTGDDTPPIPLDFNIKVQKKG